MALELYTLTTSRVPGSGRRLSGPGGRSGEGGEGMADELELGLAATEQEFESTTEIVQNVTQGKSQTHPNRIEMCSITGLCPEIASASEPNKWAVYDELLFGLVYVFPPSISNSFICELPGTSPTSNRPSLASSPLFLPGVNTLYGMWPLPTTTAGLPPPTSAIAPGPALARRANPAAFLISHWLTRWLVVALALILLALQATRTPEITAHQEAVLYYAELGITALFDVEILLWVAATLPDWRECRCWERKRKGRGQVEGQGRAGAGAELARSGARGGDERDPGLRHSALFAALPLIVVNFIAALVAVQFLRGDLPSSQTMNFGTLFTSFLAVDQASRFYPAQVFSSENWTNVLYDTAQAESPFGQGILTVLFVAGWLLFANFIVLQMFIAVINKNFDVAEEAKKGKQATSFWAQQTPQEGRTAWLRRLTPRGSVFEDKDGSGKGNGFETGSEKGRTKAGTVRHYSTKSLTALQKLFAGEVKGDIPLTTFRHARSETLGGGDPQDEETERHLELVAAFFSQKNFLRRWCQKLVQPAGGVHILGTPQRPALYPSQVTLLLIVVGSIIVESIAHPIYRRNYFKAHGLVRGAWFDIAESVVGLVFFVGSIIKIEIVADGFLSTPNAYVRSIWNLLDLVVMAGLLINVATGLIFVGGLSRLTRSLKALRALRLITLMDRMRTTLESLIISAALRILEAGILAMLYMIPDAVWGLNICVTNRASTAPKFARTSTPTPFSVTHMGPCAARMEQSYPVDRLLVRLVPLVAPRSGWVDVMGVATSIIGENNQPETNASQANVIFLIYNLLVGVVILTLFVTIIIGNFSSKMGSAFLTPPRLRAWCYDPAVHKRGWWWSRGMTFVFVIHILALMTQTFFPRAIVDSVRTAYIEVKYAPSAPSSNSTSTQHTSSG
ncbi:hypothetical protein B0H11DRAFT_2409132 [Mycena galericulata]|nr:hypothetical protein B0H11DRAFT_2409132 [Mycena galericulata]